MKPAWSSDDDLFALMRKELGTPVVGDILDRHGNLHRFLPPAVRPLRPEMIVAGRAMPVLQMDVFGPQEEPFGLMTRALDDLRANDVYLAAGGSRRSALWGEIMTAAAKTRGAAGAVVDGFHRDTPRVLEQGFPVFSHGAYAQDSAPRMKVVDFRCALELDGVLVHPGDIVFGDLDGVLVIPAGIVSDVVSAALDKARGEKVVRGSIEEGMSTTEAFKRYGIL